MPAFNDNIYDDITASLIKYCVDKIALLAGDYPTLTFMDWDTVSETHELPDTDLLGPAGCGIAEDDKIIEFVASVGIATVNDPSLFRLRKLASKVFSDFRPQKKLGIYKHDTALLHSWAVVKTPTTITPINKAGSRPLQFVQFTALLDPGAPYS